MVGFSVNTGNCSIIVGLDGSTKISKFIDQLYNIVRVVVPVSTGSPIIFTFDTLIPNFDATACLNANLPESSNTLVVIPVNATADLKLMVPTPIERLSRRNNNGAVSVRVMFV